MTVTLAPQIDSFILFLATERGLSDAYQLSVRRTLETLAGWAGSRSLTAWRDFGVDELTAFLADQKARGLEASSLRIVVVHLKIFFRFLAARNLIEADPAEPLLSPRTGAHLPETLHGVRQETAFERLGILKEKIPVNALRSDVGLRSLSS